MPINVYSSPELYVHSLHALFLFTEIKQEPKSRATDKWSSDALNNPPAPSSHVVLSLPSSLCMGKAQGSLSSLLVPVGHSWWSVHLRHSVFASCRKSTGSNNCNQDAWERRAIKGISWANSPFHIDSHKPSEVGTWLISIEILPKLFTLSVSLSVAPPSVGKSKWMV